jgi:hypothetical protein
MLEPDFHPPDIAMEEANPVDPGNLEKFFLPSSGQYRIIYQPDLNRDLSATGTRAETLNLPRERALGMMMMLWLLWPQFEESQRHVRIHLRTAYGQEIINPAAVWSNNPVYTVYAYRRDDKLPPNWLDFLCSLGRNDPKEFTVLLQGTVDKVVFQCDTFEFIEGVMMVCQWFRQNPGDRISRLYQYLEPLEMF